MPDKRFIQGKQKFRSAVEEFNKKNNRHIEIIEDYQGANKPVEFHETSVINGKTYENSWTQTPDHFERGQEGNPLFNTGKADFIIAVDEFNKKNNRHIEIVGEYQGSHKPVEFYEKSVIDGKTYENRWYQMPQNFEHGQEGNPLFNTGKADFIIAVDEFNKKNNRHVEIASKYQNSKAPVELYEKTVINGKTYENHWKQRPESFKAGQEGNPLFNTGKADFIIAVDEFNKKNNRHVEIKGEYQNVTAPIELYEKTVINGKTYENRWAQAPKHFEDGHEGNPLFKQNDSKKAEQKFKDAVDEFNRKNNRHLKINSEYQNASTPVEFYEKTVINGKTYENHWTQVPSNFRHGHEGNPLFNTGEADFMIAVDEFNQKNNRHIEIVGEYQGGHKPVEFYEKSVIDGKTYENHWYQMPQNFEHGKEGNPLFNTGKADFIVAVGEFNRQNNRNIEIIGEYQGIDEPVEFYEKTVINGKTYENRWTQRPHNFERGREGNPLFQKNNGTSFLQEFLYNIFSQYFVPKGYSVENRDTSLFNNYDGNPMELDIVVYDKNHEPKMALEPGAWYHHRDRVEHDIEKLSVCNDNDLYCLLLYFGTKKDYEQAIETESIKNYKSKNPDIQDNIWIYPNQFVRPTSQKDREDLINLVDKLGCVMGVENLSKQPGISIDDAIDHADANMHQIERKTEEVPEPENQPKNEAPVSKPVPTKFEEMLKTANNECIDIFER